MATLDGQYVFGTAVKIVETAYENAHQEQSFAGQNGRLSVFMGGRGRVFRVEGVFYGATIEDCIAARAVMKSFADGMTHTLVDNFGEVWEDVIFKGPVECVPGGPKPGTQGLWYWPYKLVMEGLS